MALAASAAFCLPVAIYAQKGNESVPVDTIKVASLVDSYMDSLTVYRQRIDSLNNVNRSLRQRSAIGYMRLFTPMTFYQDLVSHRLSLSAGQTLKEQAVDDALLSVYLLHPELVTDTQQQLAKAGTTIVDDRRIEATPSNITEKAPAAPFEPEAEKIDVLVKKPNFWKFAGNFDIHVNQLSFSGNWYQSHENNYNMLSTLTLEANYNNKQKIKWNNKFEVRLGMQTTKADTLRGMKTTEDVLRYTGNVGLQAIKKWDYTIQVIATTQSMKGYKVNNPVVYSDIMSPINIKASIGMKYNFAFFKKKMTGSVNFGALAYSWRYCGRERLVTTYGIEEGHHTLRDYGSDLTVNSNYKISKDIDWTMRLYVYTSYKRALVELENTVNFKINKYFTSKLYFYPRFDDSRARDDHHGYWGFKETFSFGLSYSF
mgnify:CR=1 FL=1